MVKVRQSPKRQRVRIALLYFSLLLFPITLYYFSPYIIVDAAASGIINASLVVFSLMFVSALVVGRSWCAWLCPAGALQEMGSSINKRPAPSGRWNWIKWGIWLPWLAVIAILAAQSGGYHTIDPFYQLESGVTLTQPFWYMVYYIIIALFLGLALVFGRRAGCHYICWMAPFMILGRRIRNLLNWPALQLRADPSKCSECRICTRECPMSLTVDQMVQQGQMEDDECILCGSCVDGCPRGAICFSFYPAPSLEQR